MKSFSGKDLIKILKKNGWRLLRVRGSHHVYMNADTQLRLSIPVHGNRSLKTGMLQDMLKTAGLTENDLA